MKGRRSDVDEVDKTESKAEGRVVVEADRKKRKVASSWQLCCCAGVFRLDLSIDVDVVFVAVLLGEDVVLELSEGFPCCIAFWEAFPFDKQMGRVVEGFVVEDLLHTVGFLAVDGRLSAGCLVSSCFGEVVGELEEACVYHVVRFAILWEVHLDHGR